jgi:hypothetical protein
MQFNTRLLFGTTAILASVFAYGSENYTGSAYVIEGKAEVQISNLFTCENGRSRQSPVGIKTRDNHSFVVPADVEYDAQYFASDLYNECARVTPSSLAEVDTNAVPVVDIDHDGEVVTGYIFADNYFELYVNGKLVAVDAVPFTPFNSSIVKFKVKKPYDIAIKAVDWEENSGLGSENNRGQAFHPGDGGLIASFSDGTITNSQWSAQTFYTAPIYDLTCPQELGSQRLTTQCSTSSVRQYLTSYSLHWDLPTHWVSNSIYHDWPNAVEFSEDEIGVNNKPAYMNFREKFAGSGARFIWSSNVILDNLVLFHYRVE